MKLFKRIYQRFTVKASKFYPMYQRQTENLEEAAQLLVELLKPGRKEQRKELCREIKKRESSGDKIAYQLYEELYHTYVTPFDRADVQLLASHIETFLDLIHDASRKIVIYHPRNIDSVWLEIGQAILEDAKILSGIMREMEFLSSKSKYIMQKCERIREIEHEVDDLYECYMSNLFEVEKDAIELTKYKNIVQSLEDATDKAKDVADCVKTIILKIS